MRSDTNLNKRFAAEGVDTRDYGSMPGVLDSNTEVDGQRVLRSHSFSGNESNSVFYNRGGASFDDISAITGIDSIADGRAFAFFDYDHDGRSDLILTNSNNPQLQLFHNEIEAGGKSISVRLVGGNRNAGPSKEWSSRDGFGAHVIVEVGGEKLRRELRCGDGFAAQNSGTLTIGVGDNETVDKVSVEWPSGKRSEIGSGAVGSHALVYENPAEKPSRWALRETIELPQAITATPPISKLDLPISGGLNLVVTMATWCPICRGEIPQLARLAGHAGDKIKFYGIPIDPEDTPEKLSTYNTEAKPPYEILSDISAAQRQAVDALMVKHFGDRPLPTTLIIDAEGNVLGAQKGVLTLSELRMLIP